MSNQAPKKNHKEAFGRFWKEKGINHIIALVIIMALVIWFAVQGRLMFSWPVWVVIVLVLWIIRLILEYRRFLREEEEEQNKKKK